MNAFRRIIRPENGKVMFDVPKEYDDQRIEVILLPLDDVIEKERIQDKINAFLVTLPDSEPEISEEEILKEIKEVRTKRYGSA